MEQVERAAVVIIGNEVLSGRTQDLNLNYIATGLSEIGVQLMEVQVIPDVEETIIDTVNVLKGKWDYVFTTGGIGPTHDDITSASIAKACGVNLIRHPEAEQLLQERYAPEDATDARMKMADIPEGAELIANPVSIAPGFIIENIYVMAGVPTIMQAMFDGIKHSLQGGAIVESQEIASYITEGAIAEELGELQSCHSNVEIGSYPFIRDNRLGTSVVLRSSEKDALSAAYADVKEMIKERGVEVIVKQ